ncbi:hypothetical protein D1007_29542 [Hordeum vulgare]|nr:hypothetical protein D1007_29542 [Hordeum vulgare]
MRRLPRSMSSPAPFHSSVMAMPDYPSPCVRHPQILLDRKCLFGQLRNSTTAKAKNSKGHILEVSFKAVDPPAISLCLVSCVDQTGDRLSRLPLVLGVAGGFALLSITFSDSVHNLWRFVDYFVYKAGLDSATLHLVARPYPSSFSPNMVAILPASDNNQDFVVIFPMLNISVSRLANIIHSTSIAPMRMLELVKEFETKGTISETKEGRVLSVVSKRLRMLRKKQNHIVQMEESVAADKMLNQEQKEVMRSKPVIAALIDELERLRMPLSTALTKDPSTVPGPASSSSSFVSNLSIQDLLALMYFSSLFYVKSPNEFIATMVAHKHERSSCITHGYVWGDTVDLLTENDLDAVSAVAALAAAPPASAVGVSHHDALQDCAHHAHLWLTRADVPIHHGSSVTCEG